MMNDNNMYDIDEEEKMSERSYVGDVELGSVVGSVQSNSNPHITSSMPNQVVEVAAGS